MTRSGQAAQRRGVFLALLALGSAPAAAIELEDGKLSLNGFGSWAYGASDRNDFLVARHTGHFDSGDFALALTSNLISGGTLAVHAEETKYIVADASSYRLRSRVWKCACPPTRTMGERRWRGRRPRRSTSS
jgi:hypothetical protein